MPGGEQYNAADVLLLPNLAGARAERTALIDDNGAYTYRELDDRVSRFARLLAEQGVAPGARLLLCLPDSVDFVVCFLGALRAGVVVAPLNTMLMAKDYGYIVDDCTPAWVLIDTTVTDAWAEVRGARTDLNVLSLGASPSDSNSLMARLQQVSGPYEAASTRRDDIAFLLYTSGTTGNPKGVVHRHGDMEFTAHSYARHVLAITSDDVVFSAAKLFFAYGLGNALTFPLSVGATSILTAGRPTPALIAALFARHQPTLFCGVPTLYAMLLNSGELPHGNRLRLCISAGEALPEVILQRWRSATGMDILDGIGTTEMLHIFISNRPGQIAPGSSGWCVPGYDARIVDDDGAPVPVGEIGDLEVRGGSAAVAYWGLPDLSAATFREGWVRTGDKYQQQDNGALLYCGRRDDLLKVGGIYVSPLEVENALLGHPAVAEAAVVGAADADQLIKPKAYVVVNAAPSEALAAELIAHVRTGLAEYKRPRWIEFVDELPKTATGKIQRYRLR